MHECRRLKRLATAFVGQSCCGEGPELFVDQRQQLLTGETIPVLDRAKKFCKLSHAPHRNYFCECKQGFAVCGCLCILYFLELMGLIHKTFV